MKKKWLLGVLGVLLFSTSVKETAFADDKSGNEAVNGKVGRVEERPSIAEENGINRRALQKNSSIFNEEDVIRIKDLQRSYIRIAENEEVSSKYEIEPTVIPYNYTTGLFKQSVLENAADYLNYQRKIAYLPEIGVSEDKVNYAQKTAVTFAALEQISHTIGTDYEKPEGMADEFWNEAASGAYYSSLTIAEFNRSFPQVIESFMYDYGSHNTSVGHRAVLINPKYETVGFGYAKAPDKNLYYGAIYSQGETTYRVEDSFVTSWPSKGVFPTNQMYTDLRWSVHFVDRGYTFEEDLSVTLTDKSTGQQWFFSQEEADGEFTVVPYAYGYRTVVFLPENIQYAKDSEYEVTVNGVAGAAGGKYTYTTKLFDLTQEYNTPVRSLEFDSSNEQLKKGESKKLNITIQPDIEEYKSELIWESSNLDVLEVTSDGTIFGKSGGNSTVTVYSSDRTVTAKISVVVTSIELGETKELATEIIPEFGAKTTMNYFCNQEGWFKFKAGTTAMYNIEGLSTQANSESDHRLDFNMYNENEARSLGYYWQQFKKQSGGSESSIYSKNMPVYYEQGDCIYVKIQSSVPNGLFSFRLTFNDMNPAPRYADFLKITNNKAAVLSVGAEQNFSYTIGEYTTKTNVVEISSDNDEVAEVRRTENNGFFVVGKRAGETKIRVKETSGSGKEDSFNVAVFLPGATKEEAMEIIPEYDRGYTANYYCTKEGWIKFKAECAGNYSVSGIVSWADKELQHRVDFNMYSEFEEESLGYHWKQYNKKMNGSLSDKKMPVYYEAGDYVYLKIQSNVPDGLFYFNLSMTV